MEIFALAVLVVVAHRQNHYSVDAFYEGVREGEVEILLVTSTTSHSNQNSFAGLQSTHRQMRPTWTLFKAALAAQVNSLQLS